MITIHRAGAKHLFIPGGSLGVRACSAGEIGGVGGATSTRSVQFYGSNDYIDCGTSSTFDFTGPFSVSYWKYQTSAPVGRNDVAIRKLTVGSQGWMSYQTGDTTQYFFVYGLSPTNAHGSISVPLNAWVHVALVYTGSALSIYIDGVHDITTPTTGTPTPATGQPLYLAQYGTGVPTDYWPGKLDDVRIYNTALSPTDVANLYAGQDVTAGLVEYWPLEEGTGTTTAGTIGGNTGTLIGGPTWSTDVPATLA